MNAWNCTKDREKNKNAHETIQRWIFQKKKKIMLKSPLYLADHHYYSREKVLLIYVVMRFGILLYIDQY